MKNRTVSYLSLIVFLLIFVSAGDVLAQDLLVLKSGKELKVTIIEETDNIVKYREYENPTGPLFSVAKDKVASIKYKKGRPQPPEKTGNVSVTVPSVQPVSTPQLTAKKRYVLLDGKPQSNKAVKTIMEDNPEALRLYDSGKRLLKTSNGCLYGCIFSGLIANIAINGAKDNDARMKASVTGLAISGSLFIAAIVTVSAGKSKIRKSVDLYNSSLNKPVSYKLDFGLQENGIGLALRF